MQEKKYPITGQSEMSSGALVRTEPVPCDFLLVAAGNLQGHTEDAPGAEVQDKGLRLRGLHGVRDGGHREEQGEDHTVHSAGDKEGRQDPAIRLRARCEEIIDEARRRSGRKKKLTLILRDLGGLIRAAGDIAVEKNKKVVTREDVMTAQSALRADRGAGGRRAELEYRKDYRSFSDKGYSDREGQRPRGASATVDHSTGIVIPIVAEVTPAGSRSEGKFIPTGKLGKIATEAVKNVSAIIKKHMGRDIANYDMHVQFVQIEGVEGDSASISVAVSIISAMENIPIDQSVAMTGSLSVRGEVLPVGGVTSKVEAAIDAGIRTS